jgi:hypothetical protein
MLISSPRTQNQPDLKQGGRGRRGRDVDWGDVQWLVDRSDQQWRMFETRIVGIFTEQSGKLEKKLDAQDKKLDAQDKKLDLQGEKFGVVSAKILKVEVGVSAIVAFFVIVKFFFKDGVGVLEALLRFARGE